MSPAERRAVRLARGEASREEARELLREVLLDGDPDASEEVLEPRQEVGGYLSALETVTARAGELEDEARAEQRSARELLASLLELPPEQRLASVLDHDYGLSWELVDLLVEGSFAAGPEDAAHCREMARLAVELAERITEGPEPAALRSDLRAAAWSQLGNAERISSALPAAEEAFTRARRYLDQGTGDSLLLARWLGFLATLRSDQSRFDEAVRAAERAAGLYRRAGDGHGYGRTLVKLATFHAYRRELDPALAYLDEALRHFDPRREPRLLFAVRHNRASYLERAGRLEEAEKELAVASELAEAPADRLRVRWLSGRLAVRRGEHALGESALEETRSAFRQAGLGYETAQVSLELAVLFAEQGRVADQKRLAEEMAPLFAERGVHPEAKAALMLYCDAARDEMVSLALVRRVSDYLEQAHQRPWMTFSRADD